MSARLTNPTVEESCSLQFSAFFKKGETILSLQDQTGRGGILEEGEAHISCFDKDGHESILEMLHEGDTFSEFFIAAMNQEEYVVIADTDCHVVFINIAKALSGCSNVCGNHPELMKTMVVMVSKCAQSLSMHVNVLSQRSIRDKILIYLKYEEMAYGEGEEFEIPFTLSSLSNYLCVDRTAMMREIRKMNDEGVIISSARKFRILRDPE